jgi:hypothetical protein
MEGPLSFQRLGLCPWVSGQPGLLYVCLASLTTCPSSCNGP